MKNSKVVSNVDEINDLNLKLGTWNKVMNFDAERFWSFVWINENDEE